MASALALQKAKNMKRHLEDHGYRLSVESVAFLLVLVANEEKRTLEQTLNDVVDANAFEPSKINIGSTLHDLGF